MAFLFCNGSVEMIIILVETSPGTRNYVKINAVCKMCFNYNKFERI